MHINCFAEMLAMSPAPANATGAAGGNPLFSSAVPLVLMVVVFYFLLIRPQQQQAKKQAKLLSALKAGDRVSTSSGLLGVVLSVKDKTVNLRTGDAKIEITKASVVEIIEASAATES